MDILTALLVGWLLAAGVQGEMELTALHEPGSAYCHRSDWVGNVRITKPLASAGGGEFNAVYDHRSCLTEEADRTTSDVLGFSWRRRF